MKTNLSLFFLVLQLSFIAMASEQKEFKFKFTYNGERLEITETSKNWESSFEKASMRCFEFFSKGQKVSESKGLDLIDVCANPKS